VLVPAANGQNSQTKSELVILVDYIKFSMLLVTIRQNQTSSKNNYTLVSLKRGGGELGQYVDSIKGVQ
jgi:hypothetical protein